MRRLCFTVDLDRDVNDAVPGSSAAVSLDRGDGNAPRFSSCAEGTEVLLDLLDELGVRATFFCEATALRRSGAGRSISGHEIGFHGLDHEDFTGARTGVHMDQGAMREVVERGICMIRDDAGVSPRGFRSPYTDPDEDMLDILPEYGFAYDSSRYTYVSSDTDAYRLGNGLAEVPAVKGRDAGGKTVTSYLWPMHEGLRRPEDFVRLGEEVEDGTFVLATHTWHMVESRSGGRMSPERAGSNLADVREVLTGLLDAGFRPMTVSEALEGRVLRSR